MGYLDDLPTYDPSDPAALGRAVIDKIQAPYRTGAEKAKLSAEDEARARYEEGRAREEREAGFQRGRADVGLPVAAAEPLVPDSPRASSVPPPVEYSHFEENVRNTLAGAPRGFIDMRDKEPTPLLPGGPRSATPAPAVQRTRAVLMPGGKILFTNQASSGQEVAGPALYDAAQLPPRGSGTSSAQAAGLPSSGDWRRGTNMEGPATRDLGLVPEMGDTDFTAASLYGTRGGGTFSELNATPDQQVRHALEDAARQEAVYNAQAGVANARQAAQDAGMSAAERAQATAASKAPELIGAQLIQGEYAKLQKAKAAFNEWAQRAATPGDPAYVEPNQRQLAGRMLQDKLGITDAEERIKVLAGVLGRNKQLPEGLAGLGIGGG